MKRRFFLTIFCLISGISFSQSMKGLSIDLKVIDHTIDSKVILIIKNETDKEISIPEIMLRNNYMSYNYFTFRSEMPELSAVSPKYAGDYHIFTEDELKRVKKINPNKSIEVEYNIIDFYIFDDEMYSVQKVQYHGPLGTTDARLIYFESNNNMNYFTVSMNIRKEENLLIAKLKYEFKCKDKKYIPKSYFTNTVNLSNEYFKIEINNKSIQYNGIVGDSFGAKNLIKNLRECNYGDIIETEVILNNFYDIPDEIKSYKIQYSGELGVAECIYPISHK